MAEAGLAAGLAGISSNGFGGVTMCTICDVTMTVKVDSMDGISSFIHRLLSFPVPLLRRP